MKNKRPSVKLDWQEIYPLLIMHYRQLNKLPVGPLDRMQTREFQALAQRVQTLTYSSNLIEKEDLSAFLMYYWPMLLAQGISLIQEIPEIPQKVLEIGSGTAPFALAALMSGSTEACTIHTNELALKSGALLSGKIGYPLSIRTEDPKQLRNSSLENKWDLIIVAHSLMDLFPDLDKQKKYILSLLDRLSDNGHLLLVDSSSLDINRHLLMLRDLLVKANVKIQAPCIWQGSCPALAHGSSPCFTQRPFDKPFIINDIQKASKIHENSLKMTYLLLRPAGLKTTHPTGERLYRVVSPPIETFKGPRYFLCGTDGKKTLGTQLKAHPKQSKAYDFLKKGDLVQIEKPLELENDLIISEDTTFTLRAPFDKPVK